jgi:hypothetical protein
MASSSIIVQISESQLKSLIEQSVRDALRGVAEGKIPLPSAAAEKPKKAKKEKDPNAPKKEPSDWIHFTSHVRSALEGHVDEGKKPHPRAVTQVASALKEKGLQGKWDAAQSKMVDTASSAQISEAYKAWLANPPAVSKMVAQGKDKSSKKSSAENSPAESAAAPVEAKKRGRKAKKDMTPEELAEHERKTKEKKSAAAPAPVAAAAPPPPAEDDMMDFEPFDFKMNSKTTLKLLKNARGDVLTEDMEWYGHLGADGKIDTDAEKPEDLDI